MQTMYVTREEYDAIRKLEGVPDPHFVDRGIEKILGPEVCKRLEFKKTFVAVCPGSLALQLLLPLLCLLELLAQPLPLGKIRSRLLP